MPSKLSAYISKRNFRITPEPAGRRTRSSETLSFVIQKHHAHRLHYDFRLELDGTLKSWAVPKGPSLDPADKRLAVHVEDHPLEYADFEGEIPKKQYGAGNVIIWDRGTWRPDADPHEGYRAGNLKFHLEGKKLRGAWALIRTGRSEGDQEQWLLIKERDEAVRKGFDVTREWPDSVKALPDNGRESSNRSQSGAPATGRGKGKSRVTTKRGALKPEALGGARKSPLPETFKPQLATLELKPPLGKEWRYEIKFDGYRIMARVDGASVKLITRNGHDWTDKLRPLRDAIGDLKLSSAWLDGEIVALDENGLPDFQALQNAFDSSRTNAIRYFLFDIPYCNGFDLTRVMQSERRALLRSLISVNRSQQLRFSEEFDEPPNSLLESARAMSLEGIIGKRCDAPYTQRRTRAWVKLKCKSRQEFVIGGFTEPGGSRTGFGSLVLGVHDGKALRYAGKVGTGFDERLLRSMSERLHRLERDTSPFAEPLPAADRSGVHWIRPELVAEVEFAQWTSGGLVRHAVFRGLRTDKPAAQVTREAPGQLSGGVAKKASSRSTPSGEPVVGKIRISNPDRVIDHASGLTKLDVASYYDMVARHMLPHLKDRPIAMLRAPQGIDGGTFFQKHLERGVVPEARALDRRLDPGHPPLVVLETRTALVGAAQMGVIEMHTWNAVARNLEKPDRIVLDLDPDSSLPWVRVVEAAQLTKTLLDELGLRSFLKTTGGNGLHIVIPLVRRHGWDVVKEFSASIARHLARTLPDQFSAKMGKQNRVKKVYVDYVRNSRGASSVAAFSVRARPGLPVSVPIRWNELAELASSNQWTVANLSERLAGLKGNPWADYEKSRQSPTEAMKRLESVK